MIVLDTDHVTVLRYEENPRCASLANRLEDSHDRRIATTAVTLEEHLRGWLAEINRHRDVHKQLAAYGRLTGLVGFFGDWELLPFDKQAADEFKRLRQQGVRIGTMDLKIASITLVHGALLLSANRRDFLQIPGLRVESWLD